MRRSTCPRSTRKLRDAISGAKSTLDKGNYKDALAAAKDLPAKVTALGTEVAAAKQKAIAELTDSWNSMSGDLPNMVDAIQSRVDTLSKSKKLPKGLDQASFDAAKSGLDEIKGLWSAATQSFNSGNVEDAVAKAKTVQQKGTEVMCSARHEERAGGLNAAPVDRAESGSELAARRLLRARHLLTVSAHSLA